jgi:hypothetical protein
MFNSEPTSVSWIRHTAKTVLAQYGTWSASWKKNQYMSGK